MSTAKGPVWTTIDTFEAGFVNSLFVMQLVLFVENGLGVKVEDEDLDRANFKSVSAVAEFVERKRCEVIAV